MNRILKRLLSAIISIVIVLGTVTFVSADAVPEQNAILLPTLEGHYVGGGYDKIYHYQQKPAYNYTRMVTSYSVQPQHVLLNFKLGDIVGKDIKSVKLLVSTLSGYITAFPTNKTLGVYEITGDWTNNGTQSLPAYNDQAIATETFTYNAVESGKITTSQGYRSLANDGYYCTDKNRPTEALAVDAKDYDHAVDITDFVKNKSANGVGDFKLLIKGIATELKFRYIGVLVTYTNNVPPTITLGNIQDKYTGNEPATFKANVSSINTISSVELYIDGTKVADATANGAEYTATVPAEYMTDGNHQLKWVATDNYGGSAVKTTTIFVKGALTKQYIFYNATETGCYAKYSDPDTGRTKLVDSIYYFQDKPVGGFRLYWSNEKLLFKYDLSSLINKDIVKAELMISNKDAFTGNKPVSLYEVTGNWYVDRTNPYKGLPEYNTTPIFSGNLTYKAATGTDTKTKWGNVSIVNKEGYPTTGANVSYGDNGATDFDQAIDVTELAKKKASLGETSLELLLEENGCSYYFGAIRLMVTYRDNVIPTVSIDTTKTDFSSSEDIVLSATATDTNGIASVDFKVGGNSYKGTLGNDGKYTATIPAGSLIKGKHSVKCVATDEYDAINYKTVEITVGKPSVNNNPVIVADLPENVAPNSDLYVGLQIKDLDYDEIVSMEATFDETDLKVNSIEYNNYYVTVPASLVTAGNHTLTVTAKDLWNGVTTKTYTITPSGKARLYMSISNSQQGNYINKYNGIYSMSQKPEDAYNKYNWVMAVNSQEMLQRFDLSAVKNYDIEKVEILIARGAYKNIRTMQVYEVLGDWSVTNTSDTGMPAYNPEPIVVENLSINPSDDADYLVKRGYPLDYSQNFDGAIDITDFVLSKFANGKTTIDLLYKCPLSSIYSSGIKLLVTYRDNTLPTINIADLGEITEGNSFSITATAEDADGIAEQSIYFDGYKIGTTQTATVPAKLVKGSYHVINVVAKDNYGAVASETRNLYIDATKKLAPLTTDDSCAMFYVGNLIFKNISNVSLQNATTQEDVKSLIKASSDGYIIFNYTLDESKVASDVALSVTYKDTEESINTLKNNYPELIADSEYFTSNSDGTISVDLSKFNANSLNYSNIVVVYSGENQNANATVIISGKTFNLTGDSHAVVDISEVGNIKLDKVVIDSDREIDYIVLTPVYAHANRADAINFTKLHNGVVMGTNATFAVEIQKTGYFKNDVTWTLEGATDSTISDNGVLSVGMNEQAYAVRVTASSKEYPEAKATVNVRILNPPASVYNETAQTKVGVLSDVHLYSTAMGQTLETAINKLEQEAGGKLDILVIAGDITQNFSKPSGTPNKTAIYDQVKLFKTSIESSLDKDTVVFYCLGNHDSDGNGVTSANTSLGTIYNNVADYFVKVLSGWDGQESTYDGVNTTVSNPSYNRYFGTDLDVSQLSKGNRFTQVNGYYFIAIEPNSYGSEYTDSTIEWLEEKLEMAAITDPNKPIFVVTHPKVFDTVYSSETENYSANITDLLSKYPQVVLYTGHTHSPLNMDSTIMQTGFTSIEASSNFYLDCIYGKFPSGYNNRANGQLLLIDSNNNIKINRYDFTSDTTIGSPWFINGTNAYGSHLFAYDKSRSYNSQKPYFATDATVSVNSTDDGITVSFDAAYDDGVINYYKVVATNTETGEITEQNISSLYFLDQMPESYEYTFTDIEDSSKYYFEVFAYDEWGKMSLPITTSSELKSGINVVGIVKIGNSYKINLCVLNETDTNIENANLLVALYNKTTGQMSDIKTLMNVNISKNNKCDYFTTLSCDTDEFNIKCFLLDGMTKLRPLLQSVSGTYSASNGFVLQ